MCRQSDRSCASGRLRHQRYGNVRRLCAFPGNGLELDAQNRRPCYCSIRDSNRVVVQDASAVPLDRGAMPHFPAVGVLGNKGGKQVILFRHQKMLIHDAKRVRTGSTVANDEVDLRGLPHGQ